MDAHLISFIIGLAALAGYIFTQRRGHFLGPYGRKISRTRNPVEFWIGQGFIGIAAAALLLFALLGWLGLWNTIF